MMGSEVEEHCPPSSLLRSLPEVDVENHPSSTARAYSTLTSSPLDYFPAVLRLPSTLSLIWHSLGSLPIWPVDRRARLGYERSVKRSCLIYRFSAILLCRLTLNFRMYTLTDEHHPTIASKRMSSVVFAHTFPDNIGASVSADEHYHNVEDSHDLKDSTTSMSNKVDNSPLAIGLEHGIRRNALVEALNKGTVIHSIAEEETENIELASV